MIRIIRIQIGKNYWDLETCRKSLKKTFLQWAQFTNTRFSFSVSKPGSDAKYKDWHLKIDYDGKGKAEIFQYARNVLYNFVNLVFRHVIRFSNPGGQAVLWLVNLPPPGYLLAASLVCSLYVHRYIIQIYFHTSEGSDILYNWCLISMAIQVVEFSNRGYKIRKVFA